LDRVNGKLGEFTQDKKLKKEWMRGNQENSQCFQWFY